MLLQKGSGNLQAKRIEGQTPLLLAEVVGSKERANTLRPESLWRVRPLFFLVEVFAPPEVDRLTKKEEVENYGTGICNCRTKSGGDD